MTRICKDCHYARPVSETAVACRRFPPTITEATGNTVTTYFPLLANEEWCGEWKASTQSRLHMAVTEKVTTIPRRRK